MDHIGAVRLQRQLLRRPAGKVFRRGQHLVAGAHLVKHILHRLEQAVNGQVDGKGLLLRPAVPGDGNGVLLPGGAKLSLPPGGAFDAGPVDGVDPALAVLVHGVHGKGHIALPGDDIQRRLHKDLLGAVSVADVHTAFHRPFRAAAQVIVPVFHGKPGAADGSALYRKDHPVAGPFRKDVGVNAAVCILMAIPLILFFAAGDQHTHHPVLRGLQGGFLLCKAAPRQHCQHQGAEQRQRFLSHSSSSSCSSCPSNRRMSPAPHSRK